MSTLLSISEPRKDDLQATRIARPAAVGLALLAVVNVLNYFDRLLITVVAEPVKKYFALSDTQLGLLSGPAFVLVYVGTSLVFGWLTDRRNRRNIMVFVLALWSAMTLLGGIAQNFLQLAIARAGVGFGEGGSNPASLSMLSDYFSPAHRGRAVAVFQASGMIGILLTFLLGGWVADRFGWRQAFFLAGLPGLLTAAALLRFAKEPIRRGQAAGQSGASLSESLRLLKSNRAYCWIILASGLAVFGNLGIMQWLPQFFVRSHHLKLTEIGLFFGPGLASGMIVGMLAGGWIGDRIGRVSVGRSLLLCVWANLLLTPLDWTLLWVPSMHLALVLTFFHAALSVLYAPTLTAAMQTVAGPRVRGMAAAIFNLVNGLLGQAFFPVLVGVTSDAFAASHGADSLRWALTIVIPICLVASALFVKAAAVTSAAQVET
jgi:MFS transporter, Spinster family, sphingosine-1-phosphate transporter